MAPKFAIVPARAATDTRLTKTHLQVLLKICTHTRTGNDRWCWLRQKRIAQDTGLVRETVNRKIRDLEQWGYIEKIMRGSGCLGYRLVERGSEIGPTPSQTVNLPHGDFDHTGVRTGSYDKNGLLITTPPYPPMGGKTAYLKDSDKIIRALREQFPQADTIEFLFEPLLKSGKRLSLGPTPIPNLVALVELASGLNREVLSAILKRLRGQTEKARIEHIQKEIEQARKQGFLVRPGTPQWKAWYEQAEPRLKKHMDDHRVYQAPQEWPQETSHVGQSADSQ